MWVGLTQRIKYDHVLHTVTETVAVVPFSHSLLIPVLIPTDSYIVTTRLTMRANARDFSDNPVYTYCLLCLTKRILFSGCLRRKTHSEEAVNSFYKYINELRTQTTRWYKITTQYTKPNGMHIYRLVSLFLWICFGELPRVALFATRTCTTTTKRQTSFNEERVNLLQWPFVH